MRLSTSRLRALRAAHQGLTAAAAPDDVTHAVRRAAALQGQDTAACRLQLRARTTGALRNDLDAACSGPRPTLARTWLMRGTLHVVPADDVRWMTALLGPRNDRAAYGRRHRVGLDDETCARGRELLERLLADRGPTTRDEIVRLLADDGLPLDPRGQAPAHLLAHAAHHGLLVRGPDAPGDIATYVLREHWLDGVPDPGFTGDEALAELALRHIRAYGPVTVHDFVRWAGLTMGQARTAFALLDRQLEQVETPAGDMWLAAGSVTHDPPVQRGVRLLGHYDPYLLGYRDRDALLDPRYAHRVSTGGGILTPTVLVDGEVRGTWRHETRGGRFRVRVEPFGTLQPSVRDAVAAEVADIGRFLQIPATWDESQT